MALGGEQPPKGIFHRSCCGRINMTFHSWKMNNIFPDEEFRDPYPFRVNVVENQHLPFWLVLDPFQIIRITVVSYWYSMFFEYWQIFVETFAQVRVSNNRVVLHCHQVLESGFT